MADGAKVVLSVENDDPVREMIVEIVETLGYKCLQAEDARTALEVLRSNEVDLILLDIHMPGPRGNQFLSFIRDHQRGPGIDTPVIVVSAFLQKEVLRELAGLNVAAALAKPIRVKRLTEEIQKVIGPESSS